MNNLNEYRKRFQTLMESTIGNVKPLISEQDEKVTEFEVVTLKADQYEKFFRRIMDNIFMNGNKSSSEVKSKFDSVATLIVNDLRKNKNKKVGIFYPESKIHKMVWERLNRFLSSSYVKDMLKTYKEKYPSISTENMKSMVDSMDLDGERIFGKYWKDYTDKNLS